MSRPPARTVAETELGPSRSRSEANPVPATADPPRSNFADPVGRCRELVEISDLLLTAVCHFVDGAAGVDDEVLALLVARYRAAVEAAGMAPEES